MGSGVRSFFDDDTLPLPNSAGCEGSAGLLADKVPAPVSVPMYVPPS